MCFHLFPLLPIEIRFQIWILTFPESQRISPVRLSTNIDIAIQRPRHPSIARTGVVSSSPADTSPKALWINEESRHLALKYYPPRDLARLKRLESRDNIRYPLYINFAKDTICFSSHQKWTTFLRNVELEHLGTTRTRATQTRAFLSNLELPHVTRVELYIHFHFKAVFLYNQVRLMFVT